MSSTFAHHSAEAQHFEMNIRAKSKASCEIECVAAITFFLRVSCKTHHGMGDWIATIRTDITSNQSYFRWQLTINDNHNNTFLFSPERKISDLRAAEFSQSSKSFVKTSKAWDNEPHSWQVPMNVYTCLNKCETDIYVQLNPYLSACLMTQKRLLMGINVQLRREANHSTSPPPSLRAWRRCKVYPLKPLTTLTGIRLLGH